MAGSDPELNLLFYLFRRGWGYRDLRALWERRDGWQEIILALAAYEMELRA